MKSGIAAHPIDGWDGEDPTPQGGGPILVSLSAVKPQAIEWLWPGRVAIGKLTLIAGDPGLGKSFLTLDMASRVSTGAGWPDALGKRYEPGGVVLLSAEDDLGDTIRPRLDAAGADVTRINALSAVREADDSGNPTERGFDLTKDLDQLELAIRQTAGCRLVIIDPVSAYLGDADSHNNSEIRALLAPLGNMAATHRVAVVAVTHLNKGQGAAIYRAMGSLAFTAAARAVWGVVKDKDDPARRLLLPIKNNIGNDRSGLAYTLETSEGGHAYVAWSEDPVDLTADDALATEGTPGPTPKERVECVGWLRESLARGPRPAKEMTDEAIKGHGWSRATLTRARRVVGVVAERESIPGPWQWRLP